MTPILPLKETVTNLIEILVFEKSKLLEGEFDNLSEMGETKSHYLEIIAHHFSTQTSTELAKYESEIARIKTLAQENESLLAATRQGVLAAQKRIKTIVDRQNTVGTYMPDGYKLQTHDAGITRQKIA